MAKILAVVGTRPEAIKMAPIILGLKNTSWAEVRVLATAQHREMLDQVLQFFGISPDIDLDIMQPNQSLASLTARLLMVLDGVLFSQRPDVVLVQGDTTTVMAVTMACFYNRIPVGHIEAGLRTWDIQNPFPEEANRVIATKLASWHFAPTERARDNLIRDGVHQDKIIVTGNTVIDALLMSADRDFPFGANLDSSKRMVLITAHRRENFGAPFEEICRALKSLAETNKNVQFLYPLHPNPNVQNIARVYFSSLDNFFLCDPLDYASFVAAMKRAYLVVTDSGGVQEEAPALGKPVLVLRKDTERPEAVADGVVKLVGSQYENIVREVQLLLDDDEVYASMARGVSPYGDGHAAQRIIALLRKQYS